MKAPTEFTLRHELVERYYIDKFGQQRVTRTLTSTGTQLATEDYPSMSKRGGLYAIRRIIDETERSTSECADCRYKVGEYTGDPGYMLYVLLKARLRLKFFKLKIRLFQILKIPIRYKCKTPSGKKIIRIAGQCGRKQSNPVSEGEIGVIHHKIF